jgi:hypothetical protein
VSKTTSPFAAGQLLDLAQVADYLGQPVGSVRRWVHNAPEGFPPIVRIGAKITVRAHQLVAWAMGEAPAELTMPPAKGREPAHKLAPPRKTRLPVRKLERTSAQIVAGVAK